MAAATNVQRLDPNGDQLIIDNATGQPLGIRNKEGRSFQPLNFNNGLPSSIPNQDGSNTNFSLRKGAPTSVVLVGDSTMAFNNAVVNLTAGNLTAVVGSTTAQVVFASHGLGPGQRCEINSANQGEFNGVWNVASVIDQNTFTVTLSSPATVATATGTVQIARGNTYGNSGPFTWMTGRKVKLLNNAGLGGDTATNGLVPLAPGVGTRLAKDVIPYDADSHILCIGINDIANGTLTAAQIFQNALTNIVLPLLALGKPLIWCTLFPTNASWAGNSTANQQKIIAYCNMIRNFCAITPNCYLADFYAALVDPTSTSGFVKTGFTFDGLHENSAASQVAGGILDGIYASLGTPKIALNSSSLDTISLNPSSTNIASNPLMQGTGGVAGTGVTGTVPTNYNVTATGTGAATVSIVARTAANDNDASGNNLVAACTGNANGDSVVIRTAVGFANQFTNNQWLSGDLSLRWSGGTNLKAITVTCNVTVNGVLYSSSWGQTTDTTNFPTSGAIPVRIPPVWVPPGSINSSNISVQPIFSASGGAVTVYTGCLEQLVANTLAAVNN